MNRCFRALSIFVMITAVALFELSGQPAKKSPYSMAPFSNEPGLKEVVSSPLGVISSGLPYATDAGIEMLRRGGNAMDAALAATLVLGVIEQNVDLFGGGVVTYYDAKSKKTTVVNFEPNAFIEDVMPFNSETDGFSGRSIRVPGTFAGFSYVNKKYGALPWKDVMEPGIFYAENGFPVYPRASQAMRGKYIALSRRPSSRQILLPDGFLPAVGQLFKQPEMAKTLKRIAEEGVDFLYKGPFAEEMVKAIRDIGGKATIEDFASYKVFEIEPFRGTYKDYQLLFHPGPADMVPVMEALNILENVDLKSMGHYSQSADSLQWMLETYGVVHEDFRRFNVVPEHDNPVSQILMSKEYAKSRYKLLAHKIEVMNRDAKAGHPPVSELARGYEELELGTHHVSAVDKDGNVCSFKHTRYGSMTAFSGLYVGGIEMNTAGGFGAFPGGRIQSITSPPIVFKGDKPYFAADSAGLSEGVFHIITNALIWDKNFKEAQEAPRFSFSGGKVSIEDRVDSKVIEELKKRGYKVELQGPWGGGSDQVAGIDPATGIHIAITDPRGYGKAAAQK